MRPGSVEGLGVLCCLLVLGWGGGCLCAVGFFFGG